MGKLLWNELVVYEMVIAGTHSWQEWMSIPGVGDWQAGYARASKWWIRGIETCRRQVPFPKWMHHSTQLKVSLDSSKRFVQYKALDGSFLPSETFTKISVFKRIPRGSLLEQQFKFRFGLSRIPQELRLLEIKLMPPHNQIFSGTTMCQLVQILGE